MLGKTNEEYERETHGTKDTTTTTRTKKESEGLGVATRSIQGNHRRLTTRQNKKTRSLKRKKNHVNFVPDSWNHFISSEIVWRYFFSHVTLNRTQTLSTWLYCSFFLPSFPTSFRLPFSNENKTYYRVYLSFGVRCY